MIRVMKTREYDVQCDKCKTIFLFDSPDDLVKENKENSRFNPMYCIICPVCKNEVWFDDVMGSAMGKEFTEKVKWKNE